MVYIYTFKYIDIYIYMYRDFRPHRDTEGLWGKTIPRPL